MLKSEYEMIIFKAVLLLQSLLKGTFLLLIAQLDNLLLLHSTLLKVLLPSPLPALVLTGLMECFLVIIHTFNMTTLSRGIGLSYVRKRLEREGAFSIVILILK